MTEKRRSFKDSSKDAFNASRDAAGDAFKSSGVGASASRPGISADFGTPKDTLDELRVMVVDYAKQETLDPIKNLGKWVAFGFAGALFVALGLLMLGLGLLRALQTQTDVFDGNFTWAPYLILVAVIGLAMAVTVRAMLKRPDFDKGNNS